MLNSTASTNGHANAYENSATDVLAAMYFDTSKIAPAVYLHDLKPALFPTPQLGLLFQTLCDLQKEHKGINDNSILERIGSQVNAQWLGDILHVYTPKVGETFEENCKRVADYGQRAGASRVTKLMGQQLDDLGGKPTQTIISQGMDILRSLKTDASPKAVGASDIGDDFIADLNSTGVKPIASGIQWLDSMTGGFSKSDVWMIAGAYKMRKTTLMINMCLNAALNGASITFLSREMHRKQVAAQMICMLAVGDLMAHDEYNIHHHDFRTNTDVYLNWLSPRALTLARAEYKRWDARKVRAIDMAIAQFKAIGNNLRIYDTTPDGGGLCDVESAENTVKRDLYLHGCELVFADYLQLFDAPGAGVYDKTAYASKAFQSLAKQNNITVVVAAQRSEEAIKNPEFAYSPGIKGGGDAAAVADFALQTRYKFSQDTTENELEIAITLSRHGSGGGDTKKRVAIHPNSGLILDSNFAHQCKAKAEDLQDARPA